MKNLIILHGALGAKIQFEQLVQKLTPHFNIHTFDFDGHGSKSNADGDFSIELFAQNLKDFMTFHEIHKPLIFGYSMGGYVALKLEGFEANSFEKVVTLGTKFDWNPVTSEKEAAMLNAEKIEAKVPEFAAYLKSLHGEIGWKLVLERTAKMMMGLGKNPSLRPYDFHHIQIPVQLLRGSEDTMVSKSETKNVQELLANGKFQEIENWMHPIDKISVDELAQELLRVYLPG
ncbi:alpha/beta fold hydrolase [Fluviicola taffensis]|uniref:Alpha/beta hydrolase fold protein n=1 Tax=Fluviicola taffensis (strain DSM 16823 / NCIMB 13979 / RW262) TaxID=755732 RepID=F2IFZ8_FLUTR|nr:alpha/beta fold hydrolase [Fluviicola taffensis]AEA43619.1 alpha/beta hydrolase fold protein [Fluviicola taffensis DSM 16823]